MPHGHCFPQGPGQGAAACPHFPKEHVQNHLAATLLPLRPPLGLPAGYWLLGCLGWSFLLGSAILAPATPADYTVGVGGCEWLDLSFSALVIAILQRLLGTTAAQLGQLVSQGGL